MFSHLQLWHGETVYGIRICLQNSNQDRNLVGRTAHPDAPEQILAGVPVYAPSAISARGGKFRTIAGVPGYVTVR